MGGASTPPEKLPTPPMARAGHLHPPSLSANIPGYIEKQLLRRFHDPRQAVMPKPHTSSLGVLASPSAAYDPRDAPH